MRVSMGAIIHRARWNFNVDEANGVKKGQVGAGRPGGGSGASPSAARSRRTA
jgi:hypothetical protein